jgi:uncharacterized membrane protein
MADTTAPPPVPSVRSITREDIRAALKDGLTDFKRAPIYGLLFGAVFSLVGIAITWALYRGDASYWIFPVAAGFPLIGPFAAVGIYEVSRRLESGEPLAWGPVLMAGFRQKNSQLPLFAVFTVFAFLVWLVLARVVFAVSFGTATMTNVMTSLDIFFTLQGLTMLVVGTVVGAALAALLFSVSVVGVPLLLDRETDFVSAMLTSIRVVTENPVVMLTWAAIISVTMLLSLVPAFLGLIFTLPILGHTTWHLYQRAVSPAEG